MERWGREKSGWVLSKWVWRWWWLREVSPLALFNDYDFEILRWVIYFSMGEKNTKKEGNKTCLINEYIY